MTKIEWVKSADGSQGKSWNPVVGCSLDSPGCTHCYAMNMAARLDRIGVEHYKGLTKPSKAGPVWTGKVALAPEIVLSAPLKRKKATTYFVNSMGDLFHEGITESVIDRIFSIMAMTPQHTYQILTKRTKRMREYLSTKDRVWRVFASVRYYIDNEFREGSRFEDDETPFEWPLTNVWVGSSIEDQKRADERIPDLRETPAVIRFLSCEPLLSSIDLSPYLIDKPVHENQTKRRVCLPSGSKRRSGDYAGRDDMAGSQKRMGSLEEKSSQSPMQEGAGGTQHGEISSGSDNGRWGESLCDGSPISVSAFQRTDSRGINNQSRGRPEEEEPSRQFRTGDLFRAATSRGESSESGACCEPKRHSQFDGEANTGSSSGNSKATEGGRVSEFNSERLRDSLSTSLSDRARGSLGALSLVIVGGESGPNARPMNPQWARDIRDQCLATGVSFFFKQNGEWVSCSEVAGHGQHFSFPDGATVRRTGKKLAGRTLDGVIWDQMPEMKGIR